MDTKMLTDENIRTILDSVSAKLEEKGARQMEVLNVHEQTTLADYFIICTGTSNTHIRTLSQEVEKHMEETRWRDCGGRRLPSVHAADQWSALRSAVGTCIARPQYSGYFPFQHFRGAVPHTISFRT